VAHLPCAGKRKLEARRGRPAALASAGSLLYEDAIMSAPRTATVRPTGFAGETARVLRSALLLLGLIGDRRAR
jgi:hypothetical protein